MHINRLSLYNCIFTIIVFFKCVFPSPAEAALVTFAFEGNINNVDVPLSGIFTIDQSISGQYTFDTATALTSCDGCGDPFYGDLLTQFTASLGTYTIGLGATPGGKLYITNNHPIYGNDAYFLGIMPILGGNISTLIPGDFGFGLYDPSGNALSSSFLFSNTIPISAFSDAYWGLNFMDPADPNCDVMCSSVSGQITAWTTVVPVPPASLLLFSGLVLLFSRVKKMTLNG